MAQNNEVIEINVLEPSPYFIDAIYYPEDDRIVFLKEDATELEIWFNEHGGILWEATTNYRIGDTVTLDNGFYVAIRDTTGDNPPMTPATWKIISRLERGGVEYRHDENYVIGDIVTDGTTPYVAYATPTVGLSPGTRPNEWRELPRELEHGGIAYKESISYSIGDIVTHNYISYRCIAATFGTPVIPVTFDPSSFENIDNDTVTTHDDLATLLAITTSWKQGDVVKLTDTGITYKKITSSTGSTLIEDWMALASAEIAGRAWSTGTAYLEGDQVWDNSMNDVAKAAIWVCAINHTSSSDNNANGSPTQPLQSVWTDSILGDPGSF